MNVLVAVATAGKRVKVYAGVSPPVHVLKDGLDDENHDDGDGDGDGEEDDDDGDGDGNDGGGDGDGGDDGECDD